MTRPANSIATLAGDLDCILLKALRKNRTNGTLSGKAAEDIEAYLDHRPVLARSGSMLYRGRRFFRRHWFAITGPALAMAGLAGGLVVAEQQRRVAVEARNVAELRRVEMQRARDVAAVERDNASRERDNAARERSTAVIEAELAERRFDQLRQLDLHLLDLDKEIMRLDGATKARQSLVTTALLYLEKLRSDRGTKDLGFRLELAEAYRRVADAQSGLFIKPGADQRSAHEPGGRNSC